MKKVLTAISEGELLNILNVLFGGVTRSDPEDEITPVPRVLYGNPLSEHAHLTPNEETEEIEEPKEPEERDLLGELTASFILDGLDVTRKDTLLMVLFDNRLRASLGEKIKYHINLVYKFKK